ncbi:MAG: nitroreductase family protein [Desulfarculales bacterium]|jgi:hypothetical protein|nr:nitroreductase family protein [Desulfarculales bacterium]
MLFLVKKSLLTILAFILLASVAQADDKLPDPQIEGGIGIFSALKLRASASGADFPTGDLSTEELSAILWAASGLNRGNTGWTVPMSKGTEPYCRIYVAGSKGVSLYDWRDHSLRTVSGDDIRARVGAQGFVRNAPIILIIVSDSEILAQFKNDAYIKELAHVLTGAMTQDIYLAAANYGIGARYIHSMNHDEIIEALTLPPGDAPICLMMLGK